MLCVPCGAVCSDDGKDDRGRMQIAISKGQFGDVLVANRIAGAGRPCKSHSPSRPAPRFASRQGFPLFDQLLFVTCLLCVVLNPSDCLFLSLSSVIVSCSNIFVTSMSLHALQVNPDKSKCFVQGWSDSLRDALGSVAQRLTSSRSMNSI